MDNTKTLTNPNIISSSMLASKPSTQIVTPTPDTTNYLGIINGGVGSVNDLTTKYNTQASELNSPDNPDSISNQILNLMGQDSNKAADVKTANDTTGVTDIAKQLTDLNTQAKNLNIEASAIPIQTQERNANTGATDAGVAPQNASALRLNALKALALSQKANIATGAYDVASKKAQEIIDLKYKPIEDNLALKLKQYELNKDALTALDSKRAEALKLSLDKQATELADKKANEKNNSDLAQGWAKSAFDSQQPELAAKISALDPTSATFKQDLANLQGQINPSNSLDSQYKKMQIAEIADKIKKANKPDDFSGLVSPVVKLPDGTYDRTTQEALLSKFPPAESALIKEIGNYKMDISKVTSLAGGKREALAAKVALVYPGFNMADYAANAKYIKDLASTAPSTSGSVINSANKTINHLITFADNVSALDKTGFGYSGVASTLNKFGTAIESPFSPAIQTKKAAANTSATGVKEEMAKFFKGTGASDKGTIDEWGKNIDPNATPGELKGAVQTTLDLLQGQLVPMMDQYKQTLGTPPPDGLFLKPDTIQNLSNLKNQGYKIDIPGVNYTDKNAWIKYGGGTQDAWNAAIEKLQTAGLPITTENILQVSQL